MPGLYEYLKDPEVVSYLALRNNPQLADQMRRNDERNYAALLSARKAAAMPDFPQMESRGNPQIEWMNRTGQAISQMKDDPALFEEASKLYAQLMDRMAQSNQLTAEQRNNAWNGYNVPAEQSDPGYVPKLQSRLRMGELDKRFRDNVELQRQKWGYRQAELKDKKTTVNNKLWDSGSGVVTVNPVTGEAKPVMINDKQLPSKMSSTMQKASIENKTALEFVNRALGYVTPESPNYAPDAFGAKNVVGDFLVQRMDPEGNSARGDVADIGSLKIHDRSGAAVSVYEFPRLRPFIPQMTDSPEKIRANLEHFRDQYKFIQDAIDNSKASLSDFINDAGSQAAQPAKKMTIDEWRAANPSGTREQWVKYYSSK